MFDVCSLANSLALGLLIFVLLFSGRRAHNRYKRRNYTGRIKAGDVDSGVPSHLEWSLDERDRDLIRGSLLATGLALLFCYLKHRKDGRPQYWDDSETPMSSFDFRYANNPEFRASIDKADPDFVQFSKDMMQAWDKARGPNSNPT